MWVPAVASCAQFVMFVVSNYVAVIGFVMMKKSATAAAEAARAPPPAYPEFAKGATCVHFAAARSLANAPSVIRVRVCASSCTELAKMA